MNLVGKSEGRHHWQDLYVRSRVQNIPACHAKPRQMENAVRVYIVPSMVRLMYQLKSVLK